MYNKRRIIHGSEQLVSPIAIFLYCRVIFFDITTEIGFPGIRFSISQSNKFHPQTKNVHDAVAQSVPQIPPFSSGNRIRFPGRQGTSLSLSLSLKLNAFCLSVCECFVAVEAVCGGVRRWNNGGVFQADIVLPNAVGACVLRASHPRRGPQCARHRSRKKMERYLRFLLTNSAQLFYLFIYFLSLTFNKIQKYKQK
jgi:hypothetical protein